MVLVLRDVCGLPTRTLSPSVGVKHEKKNFFGIEFDLLGNCIFKE
jgi:hypothetical protein